MANEQEALTEEAVREMDMEDALGEAEPWEFWETKLVMWSLVIGIGGLVVLGGIINVTILAK